WEWAGTTSIVAPDRNAGGGATLCLGCVLINRDWSAARVDRCPLCPRKRTCAVQLGISGLMQCSKLGSLLDHLVSEAEQFGWHFNAERLGGFGNGGHLKFLRLHNRQVRGLLTFENASRIDCGLGIRLRQIGAITHGSASQNVFAPRVNREHGVLRGQSYDSIALTIEKWLSGNDKRTNAHPLETTENCFQFGFRLGVEDTHVNP